MAEAQASTEGQRECARGQWCASRTVTITDGERVVSPALGYRAFCDHDAELITGCIADLPGIYLRLGAEIGKPAVTGTTVHSPFGPSVPVRLDVDTVMRLTASTLGMWGARVQAKVNLSPAGLPGVLHDPRAVRDAAKDLSANAGVLLALQPEWATVNKPLPAGRRSGSTGGTRAACGRCRRAISLSAVSGKWWAADGYTAPGGCEAGEHQPHPATIVHPPAALIPEDVEAGHGDDLIVRFGADFVGIFAQRDGAAAGLDFLHLHYWDRAVLRETPARPEELLGVECRGCSLMALRRAEPAWYSGDPEYYSECAACGDLMSEDDYRLWVGQLHAYHKARMAARPVLAATPGQ